MLAVPNSCLKPSTSLISWIDTGFTLQLRVSPAVFDGLFCFVLFFFLHNYPYFNFSAFTFFYDPLQHNFFFLAHHLSSVSMIHGEEVADGIITAKQKEANGNKHSLLGNYYKRKNANEP